MINPEVNDVHAKELHANAYAAAHVNFNRNLFFAKGIAAIGAIGYSAILLISSQVGDNHTAARVEAAVEAQIPDLDEDALLAAHEYMVFDELVSESHELVDGDPEYDEEYWSDYIYGLTGKEASTALLGLAEEIDEDYIEELSLNHDEYLRWVGARSELSAEIYEDMPNNAGRYRQAYGLLGLAAFIIGAGIVKINTPGREPGDRIRQCWALSHTAGDLYPDQNGGVPKKKAIKDYYKKVKHLPPMGSKIITFEDDSSLVRRFKPEITADTITRHINNEKHEYGRFFISQLTVQGRLPDRFKHAGLMLIMNSPFDTDWNEPFYEAHWGSVGPMIHDGGNLDQTVSKKWHNVKGRTDFIQRMYAYLSEDDEGELTNEQAILANQTETMRMQTEARFYQRAALALHCAEGTAPLGVLTSRKWQELSDIWNDFEQRTTDMLKGIGADSTVCTPWFLEDSREVQGWPGWRREADPEPIKNSLMNLEAIKREHGELREIASRAMVEFTEKVDRVIGLSEAESA
jgi:hypothetical protein